MYINNNIYIYLYDIHNIRGHIMISLQTDTQNSANPRVPPQVLEQLRNQVAPAGKMKT